MCSGDKKTLTVIVPTWNRARYLEKNLEILNSYLERGLDFKILVCNNGSTDNTPEVLRKYENHPNFRIINHPENIKFDRNVASGYLNFDTDFCFCLGDSKTLSFESLDKILETINNEDIDVLVINVHKKMPMESKYYTDINSLMSELGWNLTNISSCVIPKRYITIDRCERYYDSLFIHYGVSIDALCFQKDGIKVKYDPSIKKSMINFPNEIQPHGWSSNVCTVWAKVWPAFILSLPWNISLDVKYKVIQDVNKFDKILSPIRFIIAKVNNNSDFFKDYKQNKKRLSIISSTPLFFYDLISCVPSFFFCWLRPALMWRMSRQRNHQSDNK